MMAHLDNHFGEDASLDPATTKAIAAWLNTYASESWDTEAANRLRSVDPADPIRITAAPAWKRIHRRIDPAVFKSKSVHDRGNCAACHRDALSGRFDDQMIAIPAH
jgi:mono/diheme cytochrome c family protein